MGTATLTDTETGKSITIETTLEKVMTIMTTVTATATTTISEPEEPCGTPGGMLGMIRSS